MANLGTIQNTGSAADGADPDGDGWTNSDERTAGTDPNDRASVLKIDQIQASGDDRVITFKTVSGKTYAIMSSSSLEPNLGEVARTQGLPQENIRGDGAARKPAACRNVSARLPLHKMGDKPCHFFIASHPKASR